MKPITNFAARLLTKHMTNNTKGILLSLNTAILWATLAIALKVALNYIDSYTIVWWRFLVAFGSIALFMAVKTPSSLKILVKPPLSLVAAAILLGFNFIGYQQGVNYGGPLVAQIIIQLGPVLLAFAGFFMFKEKADTIRIAGFILTAVGFVVFYYYQLDFIPGKEELQTGFLWLLMGSVTWTGYAIINKMVVNKYSTSEISLMLYAIPMLMFLPFADFSTLFQAHSIGVWFLFLFLAFNTLLAYGSLSLALKYIDANKTSVIITLNPIITVLLMEILLWINVSWFSTDALAPMAYIGALVVLIGAIMAVGVFSKKANKGKANP